MRVLAVETSTLAGGVALLDGDRVVGEYLLDVRVTHSERLLPAVDRLLADAAWRPRDLEGLAVGVGPGSFTGLRIGVAAVKGLAFALGVPIAAVPTLDAVAARVPFAALPVCAVLTARRNEVYCSLYRWEHGRFAREWDYLALSPDDLARRLTEPVILVGNAAADIPAPGARVAPPGHRGPSPVTVGVLGLERLRAGVTTTAAELVPLYVTPSEAELRRRGGVGVG